MMMIILLGFETVLEMLVSILRRRFEPKVRGINKVICNANARSRSNGFELYEVVFHMEFSIL